MNRPTKNLMIVGAIMCLVPCSILLSILLTTFRYTGNRTLDSFVLFIAMICVIGIILPILMLTYVLSKNTEGGQ